jgi:hypothetical protein
MRRLATVLLAIVVVAGCGTSYVARVPEWWDGFEEERLGVRTWVIWVGFGYLDERERLQRFALYRAAEIASAHGFANFTVEQGLIEEDVAPYTSASKDPIASEPRRWARELFAREQRDAVVRIRIRLLDESETAHYERVVCTDAVLARLRTYVRW